VHPQARETTRAAHGTPAALLSDMSSFIAQIVVEASILFAGIGILTMLRGREIRTV
jgi:hypothetical protein